MIQECFDSKSGYTFQLLDKANVGDIEEIDKITCGNWNTFSRKDYWCEYEYFWSHAASIYGIVSLCCGKKIQEECEGDIVQQGNL